MESEGRQPVVRTGGRSLRDGEASCCLRAADGIALIVPLLGGGTTRHAHEMAAAWSRQGHPVLLVEPAGRILRIFCLAGGAVTDAFRFPYDAQLLLALLAHEHIRLLHYHNMYSLYAPLLDLLERTGLPYIVTLHDYFTICPFIQLARVDGRYCGERGEAACDACIAGRPPMDGAGDFPWPAAPIASWRAHWAAWLTGAARIFAPHEEAAARLRRYFSALAIETFENPEVVAPAGLAALREKQRQGMKMRAAVWQPATDPESGLHDGTVARRVGCIGALSHVKGGKLLLATARAAEAARLPLRFVLFGTFTEEVLREEQLPLPQNLDVLGPYEEAEVYETIVQQDIDFFWFPALWPETYSYTLSIPVRLGIPILGPALGAIGARIEAHGWGETYPWDMKPEALAARLTGFDAPAVPEERLVITNDAFPQATELYRGIAVPARMKPVQEQTPEEMHATARHLLKTSLPHGLDGQEYKALLETHPSKWRKLRYAMHLSPAYLKKFLQSHSVSDIRAKACAAWSGRKQKGTMTWKNSKPVTVSTTGGRKSSS